MSFCPQCGVDNPPAARYCDQCGAMLIPVAGSAVTPVQPAPALVSSAPVCAQCGTPATLGEAFCDNCGAPLSAPARPIAPVPTSPSSAGVPRQPTYPPPQPVAPPPPSYTPPAPSYTPPPPSYTPPVMARSALAPARLVVVATGAVLALPAATQATIGRADPVSQFFPEIDLNPHGALDNGVGRKHARLFVLSGQVMVEDLDSTNGTQINGQRLPARQPRTLTNGDTLVVGKLALRLQE
ncbi:MAG: zinc ribbon domain-containing protein [Roseiflexaceae bacterium]|nr:zinc ribbon domain-containing protein [Roseiflexaceae bacterium]